MDTQELKEIMDQLNLIPESELEFFSKDPEKCLQDMQIYNKCKKEGNMKVWEKLKMIRKMFKS
jgi:hypothetical protein